MRRLGVILSFYHYPSCIDGHAALGPKLKAQFAADGQVFDDVTVYDMTSGHLPSDAHDCDVWLISGAPAEWDCALFKLYPTLLSHIRSAAERKHPIYAVNHGEHVLSDALCAGPRVSSPRMPRRVGNPVLHFSGTDRLYRFCPQDNCITELTRVDVTKRRSFFQTLRKGGRGNQSSNRYARIASRYPVLHDRWLRHAGAAAQAALEAALVTSLGHGQKWLDAGCGTGDLARHLVSSGATDLSSDRTIVTIMDNCPEMLRHATDLPVHCVQGCLMNMPFQDNSFDVISAAWSIEAGGEPVRSLQELMRVLRPGGRLLLAFCSDAPAQSLSARALRQTIRLRKTGQFLPSAAVNRAVIENGASDIVHLRSIGPATAVMVVKAETARMAA